MVIQETKWLGKEILHLPEVDSTNALAQKMGKEGAPHGQVILADRQSAGVGRLGRNWESPNQGNVYLSMILRPQIKPWQASMLTLVMAYSLLQSLQELDIRDVKIKWPNDILIGNKKVCGVLTEMMGTHDKSRFIVIGVGINVGNKEFSNELQDKATSLYIETGRLISKEILLNYILRNFEENYEHFIKQGDLSFLQEKYNENLINLNKPVVLIGGPSSNDQLGGQEEVISQGINAKGELLVRREDGQVEAISSGEVSVRGIYGYV